jgi:hypothetical protein
MPASSIAMPWNQSAGGMVTAMRLKGGNSELIALQPGYGISIVLARTLTNVIRCTDA